MLGKMKKVAKNLKRKAATALVTGAMALCGGTALAQTSQPQQPQSPPTNEVSLQYDSETDNILYGFREYSSQLPFLPWLDARYNENSELFEAGAVIPLSLKNKAFLRPLYSYSSKNGSRAFGLHAQFMRGNFGAYLSHEKSDFDELNAATIALKQGNVKLLVGASDKSIGGKRKGIEAIVSKGNNVFAAGLIDTEQGKAYTAMLGRFASRDKFASPQYWAIIQDEPNSTQVNALVAFGKGKEPINPGTLSNDMYFGIGEALFLDTLGQVSADKYGRSKALMRTRIDEGRWWKESWRYGPDVVSFHEITTPAGFLYRRIGAYHTNESNRKRPHIGLLLEQDKTPTRTGIVERNAYGVEVGAMINSNTLVELKGLKVKNAGTEYGIRLKYRF